MMGLINSSLASTAELYGLGPSLQLEARSKSDFAALRGSGYYATTDGN